MVYNKWTGRVWLSCTSIHTQYKHYTTKCTHTHTHPYVAIQYLITETSQQGIQYISKYEKYNY